MMKNNKGLSIVELIVAIAIMSLVGLVLSGFLLTGVQSFRNSSAEVNLQNEAQLILNQITERSIGSVGDISFLVGGTKTIKEPTISTDADKELIFTTILKDTDRSSTDEVSTRVDKIVWDHSDKTVYLVTDATGSAKTEPMAKYVEKFSVDLPDMASASANATPNMIVVHLYLQNDLKKYNIDSNVTLRNSVSINSIAAAGIGAVPSYTSVSGVIVSPATAVVMPGKTVKFKALVKGSGDINQSVTWEVIGAAKSGTSIDASGLLSVDAAETSKNLTVVAKSTMDDTKSGVATVSVIEIADGIDITSNKDPIEQNMTFILTPRVRLKDGTIAPAECQTVKWTIVEGSSYVTMVGSNTFKVSAVAPVGTKISIVATSPLNPNAKGTFTRNVIKASTTGGGDDDDKKGVISFVEWPEFINRGGSGTFTVNNTTGRPVAFTVEVKDSTTGKEYKQGLVYSSSTTGSSCKVSVFKTLPYDKHAVVSVTATVTDSEGKSASRFATAQVKPVSLYFDSDDDGQCDDTYISTELYYMQSSKPKYKFVLEGIEGVSVDWKGYDKKKLGIKLDNTDKDVTLSVPSLNVKRTTLRAEGYLGTYKLNRYIEATVAGGNVSFTYSFYDSTGRKLIDFYSYLPKPGSAEFKKLYGTKDTATKLSYYNNVFYASNPHSVASLPNNEDGYFWYGYWPQDNTWYFAVKLNDNDPNNAVGYAKCTDDGSSGWICESLRMW